MISEECISAEYEQKVRTATRWYDIIAAEFPNIGKKETYINLYATDAIDFFVIHSAGKETGMFLYTLNDTFGRKYFVEILFYIKPEYRGSLRLVKKYIDRAEALARELGCERINIGANIRGSQDRYKDFSLLKLLKRWGYVDDTLTKELV
jgi:hypothetical protein